MRDITEDQEERLRADEVAITAADQAGRGLDDSAPDPRAERWEDFGVWPANCHVSAEHGPPNELVVQTGAPTGSLAASRPQIPCLFPDL